MKKKFSLLLLAVFVIIPVFALLGCDEVVSYKVAVKSSSYGQGNVTGGGTFEENSTVTLKATVTDSNSRFIAWLKPNGSIIQDDPNFQIENTENGGRVVGSTISFIVSASTSGTYIAVFDQAAENMQFITLDSFRVADEVYDSKGNFIADTAEVSNDNLSVNLTVSQGTNSSNITPAYTASDLYVKINEKTSLRTLSTLKLDTQEPCQIRVNATFVKGISISPTFRGELLLAKNSKSDNGDVVFKNGYYHLIFSFSIDTEHYYFVLTYHVLTA